MSTTDSVAGSAQKNGFPCVTASSLVNFVPLLRGDDLRALGIRPGPIYREVLNCLLYARLDGSVQSRDDELRFVRRRFARALPAGEGEADLGGASHPA